ncbi:MAG: Ig-like domain-containing protein [Prevotella sp.]|nr:Ig-like domain-containing protein [Staphylococcus sp.]MCM1350523.1 Ig-like domain-containing protein [Prevotella sp.]
MKKLFSLFIFLCLVLTNFATIQANQDTIDTDYDGPICCEEVTEYSNLKDYYESNEISLEYAFKNSDVKFSNIETNGGTLTDVSVDNTLTFDFIAESKDSSVEIKSEYNGNLIQDTIYFSEYDGKYFTSCVSEEQAKREVLFYQLENGIISKSEYEVASYALLAEGITNEFYVESYEQAIAPTTTMDIVLQWEDDWGTKHTLNYTKVEVIKRVYFGGVLDYPYYETIMDTLYSDKNGHISYTIDSVTDDLYGYYIKVYAASVNTNVVDNNKMQYYYESPIAHNVPTGSTIYFNYTFDMTTDLGRAFQLSQALHYASQYVKYLNNNVNIENCTLCYGDKGAYYDRNSCIYIKAISNTGNYPQGYADWDVVGHEYGHHVQECFPEIARNPGGTHYINTNNADSQYEAGYSKNIAKDRGMRLSWAEGWATYFGQMMQKHSSSELQGIRFVNDDRYTAANTVNHSMLTKGYYSPFGETDEVAIAQILYQLDDARKEGNDVFDYNNKVLWKLVRTNETKTFSDFYRALYNYEINKDALSRFLADFYITPGYVECTTDASKDILPSFEWDTDNGSKYFPFDEYQIHIATSRLGEIYVGTTTETEFTMPVDVWNQILDSNTSFYYITVSAAATQYISSGPYYSETYEFIVDDEKPLIYLVESDYKVETPMLDGAITSAGMKVTYTDDSLIEEVTYEYTRFNGRSEKWTIPSGFTFFRKGEYTITVTDMEGNTSVATFTITDYDLVVDPEGAQTVGTEVTSNGGAYGDPTMSVGYTRCIYLGPTAPSQSRLDYTFTSSDETIATVSAYGTIEAKSVGRVVITCVNNDKPTQVSKIVITVLP